MSNMDFSRLVTREMKAAQTSALHLEAVKVECQRRILERFPFEVQQNITRATMLYALDAGEGQDAPVLEAADIAQVRQGHAWIAAMQKTCKALSADIAADLYADKSWPVLPEGVAWLIARY